MEEFGDHTTQHLFMYAQCDLDLSSVIESKYLGYVERGQDVARLMRYFKHKFEQFDQTRLTEHQNAGFFLVPLQRAFSFLLTRVLMRYYASERMQVGEESKEPPTTGFHDYLLQLGFAEGPAEL